MNVEASRRRVVRGALALAGAAVGFSRRSEVAVAGGGVEIQDSGSRTYVVRSLSETLVSAKNRSRTDYDEDGANEIVGLIDEICVGQDTPSVSFGVNRVHIYQKVEPGCVEKLLQLGVVVDVRANTNITPANATAVH